MATINNKHLAILVIAAMVLSVGTTFSLLRYIDSMAPRQIVTGRATNVMGNVSLEVLNQVSIILNDNSIDFGTGSINTSCEDILTNGLNYANLTAGATFTDSTDCWTGTPVDTTPYEVENNGNLNASVSVRGPTNTSFFNGYAGSYPMALMITSRDSTGESGSCAGTLLTAWTSLDSNATICDNLVWDPGNQDEITVDLNVLIPKDLSSGTYQNQSIEFYAIAAN